MSCKGSLWDRVVGAEDFEWFGVAGCAVAGEDDVVVGGVPAGEAGEADAEDHCCGFMGGVVEVEVSLSEKNGVM